jgi:hypothetical protein
MKTIDLHGKTVHDAWKVFVAFEYELSPVTALYKKNFPAGAKLLDMFVNGKLNHIIVAVGK